MGPPNSDEELFSECLYIAGRNGHTDLVAFFLSRGGAVDHPGYFGAPALHWAAVNGHEATVRFLLAEGADPTLRDSRFDADAAGWAAEGGYDGLRRLLEEARGG